jgi:hypothetical protein
VYFTDEVHFNTQDLATKQEHELIVPGSQARLANIQEEKKSPLNATVHVRAGVSYNFKGPLRFYNDPAEKVDRRLITNDPRPRKGKSESNEHYREVLKSWEARQPHVVGIKPKGNSILSTSFQPTLSIFSGYRRIRNMTYTSRKIMILPTERVQALMLSKQQNVMRLPPEIHISFVDTITHRSRT